MDLSNRTSQPQTVAPSVHSSATGPAGTTSRKNHQDRGKWNRIIIVVMVSLVTILLVALVAFIGFGNNKSEGSYVDTSKLQAVFLNTGQVYFGNIKALNSKYFVLQNIYYLQTSNGSSATSATTSTSANTSVSLVKLGCELHEPYDQMVINSQQVTFWENLQTTGQVAKAVQTFQKENPNGQKCSDQSSSSTSTTNTVQNAGTKQ